MAPALAMISMLAVSQKLQRNKKRNMLQYILTMLLRKRKVCKAKAFAILMIAMKARNANEVPRIRTCRRFQKWKYHQSFHRCCHKKLHAVVK